MAKPVGGTTNNPPSPVTARPGPEKLEVTEAYAGGINNVVGPSQISDDELVDARNVVCRFAEYTRRPGFKIFVESISPPYVERVLKLHYHILTGGGQTLLRFTPTSVYRYNYPGWQFLTGTIVGGNDDRFNVVSLLGKCVFTNNGADQIQAIDFGANTYADLRATSVVDTQYKYCTGIYNRVLAANLSQGTGSGADIGWSAEYPNIDIWDPSVDQTAGTSPLIDSPADYSDEITGVHSITDIAVIPRQRSMWIGRKQPIPTNPFYFQNVLPDIGCNSPYSVAVIPGGLCWADYRTNAIWAWQVGEAPENIGLKIQKDFWSAVADEADIFSTYDPINKEFLIGYNIPSAGITRIWVYNFITKAWV